MATGVAWTAGFVADPTDVKDAGAMAYADMIGIEPGHALIAGGMAGGSSLYDPDARFGETGAMVSLPGSDSMYAPASKAHDNWRDMFDPHSPAFWVWIFVLAAVGLIGFRVEARGGPARVGAGVGTP
jgi:hypothetical protein